MKFGRGPATVIGSSQPSVRIPTSAVAAVALREKERGSSPIQSRGAFLLLAFDVNKSEIGVR